MDKYNIGHLKKDELLYNVRNQQLWKASYDITDPYGSSQAVCLDIIKELKDELKKRNPQHEQKGQKVQICGVQ